MKHIAYYALLSIFIFSCNRDGDKASSIDELKLHKSSIDTMISEKSIVIWVKVEGENKLIKVENKSYPKNIVTTYNVLKDKNGHILYIAELPFSKTSDWFIAYRSYFYEDGKLFAFQKLNNFLHSGCVKGAAIEKSTRYFSRSNKVIDSAYSLTDSYSKPIDKAACKFPYDFPFKIFATADSYIAERGLN